ncbi:hypothetical protein EV368DRAFT_86290 [Lentinula lateritia]|nr:hypothetical protein EV368DRAFT_86290 [Lentinula lateritia]
MSFRKIFQAFLLTGACLSSIFLTVTLYKLLSKLSPSNPTSAFNFLSAQTTSVSSYSLKGDDFPHFVPMELPPAILMAIEESVHYSLTDPEAEKEWLYNSPWGTGSYRIDSDPTNRAFFVAMFHQLHCLRRMRAYFTSGDAEGPGHVQHCLSFLRLSILCQADTTIEQGDFMKRNFSLQQPGSTHVCRDWDYIYDKIGNNWLQWYRYTKVNNILAADFST